PEIFGQISSATYLASAREWMKLKVSTKVTRIMRRKNFGRTYACKRTSRLMRWAVTLRALHTPSHGHSPPRPSVPHRLKRTKVDPKRMGDDSEAFCKETSSQKAPTKARVKEFVAVEPLFMSHSTEKQRPFSAVARASTASDMDTRHETVASPLSGKQPAAQDITTEHSTRQKAEEELEGEVWLTVLSYTVAEIAEFTKKLHFRFPQMKIVVGDLLPKLKVDNSAFNGCVEMTNELLREECHRCTERKTFSTVKGMINFSNSVLILTSVANATLFTTWTTVKRSDC
ncbi:hypothetical protein CAPTEDRAFT_213110, partial [Capitella teleta]